MMKKTGVMLFLGASIIFNLFLSGVLVGSVLNKPAPRDFFRQDHRMMPQPQAERQKPPPFSMPFMPMMEELTPDERQQVEGIFKKSGSELKDVHQEMDKSFAVLKDIFKQEKIDQADLDKAFLKIETEAKKMHGVMKKTLQEVATKLPVELRRKMAEAMDRHRPPRLPPPPEK